MKKRIVLALTLVMVLVITLATPALASLSITGIYYNFDAAENENALTVNWVGRPAFEIKANEFYSQKVQGQWETPADVEERIQEKFLDLLVEDIPINQVDPEDECMQDPPILNPGEEWVVVQNKDVMRLWKAYFKIHIYSLDDLETPESELRFLTRFQNVYAGQIPDNWWPVW